MTLSVAVGFCGAGGSSLGHHAAGDRVAYAFDAWPLACATHAMNLPGTRVECRDARRLTGREVVKACGGVPDLLELSPPCVDFTTNGMLDADGAYAALYSDAVRLVREVGPRAFAVENVPGLARVRRMRSRHFLPALAELRSLGYGVASRMLSADRLGVPQTRRRVVVVGIHGASDAEAANALPRMGPVTAVRDVLPGIAAIVALPAIHYGTVRPKRRWPASRPGPTLTAGGMSERGLRHLRLETEDGRLRGLTVADLLAISGFPPGFRFPAGTPFAEAWRMLGNCVPPPMARAWAEGIARVLEGRT